MLDKDAQKSLLDNAAEVNKTILAVCEANVTEYTDKLMRFTDPTSKVTDENAKALHMETFGKEARQSLNIKTLLDLPDMKDNAINTVIEIMNDREKKDKVVKEILEIAAVKASVTTTRIAPVVPKTAFTDYYKTPFDVTYWFQSGVFSMVLPIFKEDDASNVVITINTTKEISYEFMSDDDVLNTGSQQIEKKDFSRYNEEIEAIKKTDKYKEWENAESYLKSAKEINDQMEIDKKNAQAKIAELNKLLVAKEAALKTATSTSDTTQEAALAAEIDEIKTESLPAEQIKVDHKMISDGFKQDLKTAEDNNEDWWTSLLTNAKAFDKNDLFKDNEVKRVFTMGKNAKQLNPLDEGRASPLWFISSSINGSLGVSFLKEDKVKKVIQEKIETGDKFYSIKTGEQFTSFAAFLNFDKPGFA